MLASAPTTPKTMAANNNILRIGLAQIDGRLGDVEHNAGRHLEWIARAREAGVDLLVFPELSLTGYRLLHLTPRVALPLGSPVLTRLAEAAGPMRVVLGFVEEGERGVLHNSAVAARRGRARPRPPQALPAHLRPLPGGALLRRRPAAGDLRSCPGGRPAC